MKYLMLFMTIMLLAGCGLVDQSQQSSSFSGPLTSFFEAGDKLIKDKKLEELSEKYNRASIEGDETTKASVLASFESAQKAIIDQIAIKYPSGTVSLPIEQKDQTSVSIKGLSISEYMFPWNTATKMSYRLSFDCTVNQTKDLSLIHFDFYDAEGDLFMTSNVSVFKSGSYTFEIRPETEFFHFEKVVVTVI